MRSILFILVLINRNNSAISVLSENNEEIAEGFRLGSDWIDPFSPQKLMRECAKNFLKAGY